MGRRSKLTPEAKARFVQAITAGSFPEVAAHYAGFSPASLYRYLKGTTPAHLEFREAATKAMTEFEVRCAGTLARAALSDPRWALVLLERRFPERWARRSLVDEVADEAGSAPGAASDERVVLDPNLLQELVPRLLEAGKRLRADPSADGDPVARFEDRAPRRVRSNEGGTR